ncbi:hypothetical protein DTO027B5_4530 [Paecilomyces variotii]|nr:hypothetical protein DTO027B3_5461 [Paecilomyces variotii]KAJ9333750.1 hypothetical protein DTO027B5_4530 [Paecilomyces variotii]
MYELLQLDRRLLRSLLNNLGSKVVVRHHQWPSGGAASPAADPQTIPAINAPNEESKGAQDASTESVALPAQANSATAASALGNNANAYTPQANNGAQNGAATSTAASPSS